VRRAAAVAAASLAVGACTLGAGDTEPLEGRWRSEGFGLYLVVEGRSVDLYEHTAISCGLAASGSARGIDDLLSAGADGRLLLEEPGRSIRFDPVELLPEACGEPFASDDPLLSFRVAATTMEEHYAFFELRDPAWAARRAEVEAGLPPEADPAGLLASLQDLLSPTGDAQVRLAVDDPDLLPGSAWSAGPPPPEVEGLAERIRSGAVAGLEQVEVAADGGVVSGLLPGGAGYLAVTRLAGFGPDPEDEERVLASAIDDVLRRFADAPGMVVDVRVNRGGREALALLVASRFVPAESTVATREVRVAGTERFVDGGKAVVRPLPSGTYPGRLVMLAGPGTVGAAELLVLALRSVPKAVQVGEPTAGSLSPLLVRGLPNGWTLGLSNQRVRDATGELWEGVGIPPDVAVSPGDLGVGIDPALERAAETAAN
jgi:hypothetical protein